MQTISIVSEFPKAIYNRSLRRPCHSNPHDYEPGEGFSKQSRAIFSIAGDSYRIYDLFLFSISACRGVSVRKSTSRSLLRLQSFVLCPVRLPSFFLFKFWGLHSCLSTYKIAYKMINATAKTNINHSFILVFGHSRLFRPLFAVRFRLLRRWLYQPAYWLCTGSLCGSL